MNEVIDNPYCTQMEEEEDVEILQDLTVTNRKGKTEGCWDKFEEKKQNNSTCTLLCPTHNTWFTGKYKICISIKITNRCNHYGCRKKVA